MNRQDGTGAGGSIQPVTGTIRKASISAPLNRGSNAGNGLVFIGVTQADRGGQWIAFEARTSPCAFMSFIFVPAADASRFALRPPAYIRIRFYGCWGFTHSGATTAKSGSIC